MSVAVNMLAVVFYFASEVLVCVMFGVRGLAASAGVWLRANETEISAFQWALVPCGSGRTLVLV